MSRFSELCSEAGVASPHLVFIGGGNMASALIQGAVRSGFADKNDFVVTCRTSTSLSKWKANGYEKGETDNQKALENHKGAIVVLSVKPQMRHTVYKQISGSVLSDTSLVISLMAGVNLKTLHDELSECGFRGNIIRLLPNTPCAVGRGSTVLSASENATSQQIDIATALSESVGICVRSDEKQFNAAGVVAGCGPAFTYLMIEALADGGVLSGCNRADSMRLAAQTVMGAAQMVLESGEHPGALKDKVCSPAGTTIAGVRELEKAGVRSAFIEAVKAGTDRANSM